MWTAEWWWEMQVTEKWALARVNKCATIVPLIIASDKTSLSTLSGGQQAYPVYLTIGNISKSTRRKAKERATVLIGYLPVDKFEDVTNKEERARLRADMTHRAMEQLMAPLKTASEVGFEAWCADGRLRHVYPIVAAFVGDWPEQNLMACTNQGGCPICTTPRAGRGDLERKCSPRRPSETLTALRSYRENDRYLGEVEEKRLKPWWPWWAGLPHVNFHASLPPDLLHQLHQGIFKSHILPWAYHGMKEAPANWRFQAMSKAEGMRHFKRKISKIKQWTGRESKELMKQFLPAVVGSGCDPDFTELVRAMLDFIYYAHSVELTEEDLEEMEQALRTVNRLKSVIVRMGAFEDIKRFDDIPKWHMLTHYTELTRQFGAPDGYNSESPEHLHIVYAKTPYRATNKVQPTNQMVKFVQRQDALRIHKAYLRYVFGPPEDDEDEDENKLVEVEEDPEEKEEEEEDREEIEAEDDDDDRELEGGDEEEVAQKGTEGKSALVDRDGGVRNEGREPLDDTHYPAPVVALAKTPTRPKVAIREVIESYGASDLISALSDYLIKQCHMPADQVILAPNHPLPVWHRLSLYQRALPFASLEPRKRDVVRARWAQPNREAAFDTVLLKHAPEKNGLPRYRAARVRAIFGLPTHIQHFSPQRLAYVELFTPFTAYPVSPFHRMYATGPSMRSNGRRHSIVIPVTDFVLSCHLAPNFRHGFPEPPAGQLPTSTDSLSVSRLFFFNQHYNYYVFKLCEQWRRARARL
ncbi:hypothetical protein FRC12_002296 [Ceratobasidium sp. 428]|nr:hypothetical protein FRC12_002296 [Ceratobasidium sp. 428]